MTSETVYVRGQSMGNGGIVLHTDQDCSHLHLSNAVLEHPRDAYPDDQSVCEFCAREYDPNSGDPSGPWETLEVMDADDLVTDGGQDIGQSTDGTELTYKEIRNCDETVEVNKLALLRAYHDGLFDNLGDAHERMAKNRLKDIARSVGTDTNRPDTSMEGSE